ncbi:helicase-associated domain-containing protein [Mycobacterium sp. SM1]|uniref:helicase-associated domain-containing protein n=1 Tax=Mycobacterium sp. SM1 TaxID=2816243 RepID=UPI001BCF01FA|nr:helicase-associated domain-containing protein [Mycobacterium sp. SM1]MBS4727472.1 helicase-associated domain-containing protein [Mycobacterium sp. SM1]
MTEHTPDIPLGSWLADLPDQRLVRLLELRPDLAQPAPGSIAALAARAQARQSIRAATDDLDFLRLALLDALLVLHADTAPVPVAKLLALIGRRAPESEVLGALDDLKDRALVWGDPQLRVAADAAAGLPWHPGQVTLEDDSQTGEQIGRLIAELDDQELAVLDKLRDGSPLGRTRDAAPGAPPDRPVPRLLAKGLLRRIDAETVIVPRLVGHVLRGQEPGPTQLSAPDPVVVRTTQADVDAAAAGAVIDLLRELDVVLENLGAAPVAALRSGGLGVREVRRLAKAIGIGDARLGLILEVAAAAGLIACGTPDPRPLDGRRLEESYWAPTVAADRFAEAPTADRWRLLARAWLDLPARPGLIGTRGPDAKPYGALSDSVYSTAAPLDRRLLLSMLAELPAGVGVDTISASKALVWRRPRWSARLQPGPVADLLDEAHRLGLVGRGAISTPGRALLADDSDDAAVTAMAQALPRPITHFLVQADLTVVVPGPLERRVAQELAAVATVESAGTAMVYRVSEQSIRHALDIGKTAESLHALFERHSKTPVPQGLTYLIDDVARRHGQLRIGAVASFVRCDDPALLAAAVTSLTERLHLRVLAPTVAVSPAPVAEVLGALRGAGFAPAAEDSSGAIVDIRSRGARITTPQRRRAPRLTPRPSREALSAIVAVLRRVSAAPLADRHVDATVAMSRLQRAARHQATLVIGYVDSAGVPTQRAVAPITLHGGQLVAFDLTSGRLRDFAIHRITSVVPADDG